MRKRFAAGLCLLPIALVTLACTLSGLQVTDTGEDALGTQVSLALTQTAVAATQTALAQPPTEPPTPTETPAPALTGTIGGNLCYPSEGIPPLTVYAQEIITGLTVSIQTAENQAHYAIEVPAPGTYIVFAYTAFGLGGSYSAAVPCGLTVDCTDHAPIQVEVQPGATVGGADICDFYGPEGSVPPNPNPPAGGAATFTGRLCYPSEFIPPLFVYAREVNTGETVVIETAENQSQYSLEAPAPGTYIVFAYTRDLAIGASYSPAVPCGLSAACTDHTPIQLSVAPGQTLSDVDPCDYYGPAGSVPAP